MFLNQSDVYSVDYTYTARCNFVLHFSYIYQTSSSNKRAQYYHLLQYVCNCNLESALSQAAAVIICSTEAQSNAGFMMSNDHNDS